MMSLAKSVPEGVKPQECKRMKLREPLPVPYVPDKDEVQEEVTKLRNFKIKTTVKKDTTINFPVWHKNGTREAFLMHVTALLDAIRKMVPSRTTRRPKRLMWRPKKRFNWRTLV